MKITVHIIILLATQKRILDTSQLNKTVGPKERSESPDKTKPDNLHLELTVIESERTHTVTSGENQSYFRCLKLLIQVALVFILKF